MTQKEMVKLLTAHGWIKTRGGKGSHIKIEKQGERPITILHGELNKYTERGIGKASWVVKFSPCFLIWR
nr:type II toxin-antitoxin system HicA family toxin [Streptococcus pneumoniae]